MIKNGSVANIREVYTIAQRLEDKIDALDTRMSNMEGKTSVLAIAWSSFISILGLGFGYFIKK